MNTKAVITTGLIIVCSLTLYAQEVYIDSLEGHGQLTLNAPSNSDFTVEWASSLTPSPKWRSSWIDLYNIQTSNGIMTVDVPMFYRVTCWTNGLLARGPVGRTYTYGITNKYGQAWTEKLLIAGQATIPSMSNNYVVIASSQEWDAAMPQGAESEPEVGFIRLTDKSLFYMDPAYQLEVEIWRMDEVGTSWTNFDEVVSVEAYESVTVPAGTFTNCLRLHQRDLDAVGSDTGARIWIKPGFIEIKSVYYADWTDPPDAAPVVYQLQSWSDD